MAGTMVISVLGKISGFNAVTFQWGCIQGKVELVSIFYTRHINRQGKNIFFIPHSLLQGQERELVEIFEKAEKIVIPSIGPNFGASHDYIVFYIFCHLAKKFLEGENINHIVADINQGHNIYVDALKDAVRIFKTFYELMYFHKKEKLKAEILFSDPILGDDTKTPKRVYLEDIKLKIFFTSPLSKDEITTQKLSNKADLTKNEVKIIKNFYRTFKAVQNNAPLVITTFGYDSPGKILDILRTIVERYIKKYCSIDRDTQKYTVPNNLSLCTSLCTNVLLSLALYHAVSSKLCELKIPNKETEWIKLETIKKFIEVYKCFNLLINEVILERDLKNFESITSHPHRVPQDVYTERGCYICELEGQERRNEIDERNFWAHSGFEKNVTKIRKREGVIELAYDRTRKGEIGKLVLCF